MRSSASLCLTGRKPACEHTLLSSFQSPILSRSEADAKPKLRDSGDVNAGGDLGIVRQLSSALQVAYVTSGLAARIEVSSRIDAGRPRQPGHLRRPVKGNPTRLRSPEPGHASAAEDVPF